MDSEYSIPRLPRSVSPQTMAGAFMELALVRNPTAGNVEDAAKKLGVHENAYHAIAVIQQFRDLIPDMAPKFWDMDEKSAYEARDRLAAAIIDYLEGREAEVELLELEIEEGEELEIEKELAEILQVDEEEELSEEDLDQVID